MGFTKKIGCLGLSANPPHLGHLKAARLILHKKLVDEVWLIPCFRHAFDKNLVSSKHRWRMTQLLEQNNIKAKDIELRREGKSYAIDTIRTLRKKYPQCKFFWIIGSDIIRSGEYKKWKDWEKLKKLAALIVVHRPGFPVGKQAFGRKIVPGIKRKISSTEIRKRIKEGSSIDGLVPVPVKKYIQKHNLYRE